MPKRNAKTLSTLKRRLEIEFKSEIKKLDKNIQALLRKKAATKELQNGNTLACVRDLCNETISTLAKFFDDQVIDALNKHILATEPALSRDILTLFEDAVPESLEFVSERISKTLKIFSGDNERLFKVLFEEVLEHYQQEIQKLSADIELHISSLGVEEKKEAKADKHTALNSKYLWVGIVAGLFAIFLYLYNLYDNSKSNSPEAVANGPTSKNEKETIPSQSTLVSEKVEMPAEITKPQSKASENTKCYSYVKSSLEEALKTFKDGNLSQSTYEGLCIDDPSWFAITQSGTSNDFKTGIFSVKLKFYPSNISGKLTFTGEPPQLNLGEYINVTGRINRFRAASEVPHPKTGKNVKIPASIHITGNAKIVISRESLKSIIYESVAKVYSIPIESVKDDLRLYDLDSFEDSIRSIEVIVRAEELAKCSIADDEVDKILTVGDFITIATPFCAGPL